MELWFICALLSVLFAGIAAFLQKVAVERGYHNVLFNTFATLISTIPAYALALLYTGDNNWIIALILGTVSGILYLLSTFTRTAGMQNIDTALFFPLYKTFGPILITLFGFLFFQEWLTTAELLGVGLGILIPLLLIHKSEQARQRNLKKGLLFMLLTVLLTSSSTMASKLGAEMLSSVFLFAAVASTIGGIAGIGMLAYSIRNKEKSRDVLRALRDPKFLLVSTLSGVTNITAFLALLYAFKFGGHIAIAYTINSFYILIPIILSIMVYKEHWNVRKALAIMLSLVALAFFQ